MTAPATAPGRSTMAGQFRGRRSYGDRVFRVLMFAAAGVVLLALAAMTACVVSKASPALRHYGVGSFVGSARWAPSNATAHSTQPNPYGILQFIYGTAVTSLIGMVIALPVSVAVALYISDVAPQPLRRPLTYLTDLLASIPSVVYGFWGIFALIPYFTAGVVLAIMVLPIITAICRETFTTTPADEKEAALALGLTRWEMLRTAILPRSHSGIAGAAILGLGRALGETIAVTMVIGNSVLSITKSIFGQGATMASAIANEFTEATQPFHLSSLFVVASWLLVIALAVNVAGKLVVRRIRVDVA